MIERLTHLLGDFQRKNSDDFKALLFHHYPDFVFDASPSLPRGQLPVFVFHDVTPAEFELKLRFLAANNYRTLTAEELYSVLVCRHLPPANAIVLTFDDGLASLWTTAYPLLHKYGLHAIAFIVSHQVPHYLEQFPNLFDVWRGAADIRALRQRYSTTLLSTWSEIREMQASGVIEFQSHTSHHHSVFTSSRIRTFAHPDLHASFVTSTLHPVIRRGGEDLVPPRLDLGQPIYSWAATMAAQTRFMEDEALSHACIAHVRSNGERAFFQRPRWRRELHAVARDFSAKHASRGLLQTFEQRASDIQRDLAESKETIEHMIGSRVLHLCYPWYAGSRLAVEMSQRVGYTANYWGLHDGKTINRAGTDPYQIARLSEDYLLTLPGKDRVSLVQVLAQKLVNQTVLRRAPDIPMPCSKC